MYKSELSFVIMIMV